MSVDAIVAENLTKRYDSSATPVVALRGVTLAIRQGERVALLGKSGSGKSTLLNMLGGIDRPTTGKLHVAGKSLDRLSDRELANFRATAVGMIFQSFNLIPSRTALDNVALPLIFTGHAPQQRHAAARRALAAVGLHDRADHRPAELSGGENQRVAIARALVNHPSLLLADEPTGNLDSTTAREIMSLISNHVAEAAGTLILVTHDEELAAAHTDRIVRLKDGQLLN